MNIIHITIFISILLFLKLFHVFILRDLRHPYSKAKFQYMELFCLIYSFYLPQFSAIVFCLAVASDILQPPKCWNLYTYLQGRKSEYLKYNKRMLMDEILGCRCWEFGTSLHFLYFSNTVLKFWRYLKYSTEILLGIYSYFL